MTISVFFFCAESTRHIRHVHESVYKMVNISFERKILAQLLTEKYFTSTSSDRIKGIGLFDK